MSFRGALAITVALLVATALLPGAASAPASLEVVGAAWVTAPAVAETPRGLVGVTSNISVIVTRGWGDVYVSTFSLTERDFQGAAATAARVAARLAGANFSRLNFYFRVQGDAVIVGGPSAGVAMTVAAYAALTGARVNRSVAVTGMVAPDGSVGPVGGIYEKAWAASRKGVKLFLVPPGQSVVVEYKRVERRIGPFIVYSVEPVKVNLSSYAPKHWGLRVVEVATVREAIHYMTGASLPAPTPKKPFLGAEARARLSTVRGLIERRAWGELNATAKRLSSARIPGLLRARLNALLRDYGLRQLRAASQLPPYSAERLHLAEGALAAARWASLLLDYYGGANLSETIRSLSARWNATAAGLESTGSPSLLDAETQVLAADALVVAARNIDAAREAWSSSPEDSLRLLALASVSIDEADAWAGQLGQGRPRARDEAGMYLLAARSTWPYVSAVAQETGAGGGRLLGEAEAYYVLAREFYARRLYLVAAAAASRSLALSQAAMDAVQLVLSGQPVYLEYSEKLALASAGPEALASVYFYNLSRLYTGYGDRLVYYKLASQSGELAKALSGAQGVEAASGQRVGGGQPGATESPGKPGRQGEEGGVDLKVVEKYLREALELLERKGYLQLLVPGLVILLLLLVVAVWARRRGSAKDA